jgi:hypothetical protein
MDSRTAEPVFNAKVTLLNTALSTNTSEAGVFLLTRVPLGDYILQIQSQSEDVFEQNISIGSETTNINIGIIRLSSGELNLDDGSNLDAVILSESELDDESNEQEVSSLLTASRDVFVRATNYNFSVARFRSRGHDGKHFKLFLNGAPVNDLEDGRYFWSVWGGLNDMFRYQNGDVGLANLDFGFGGLSGAGDIDLRASSQRKQIRASYAISNRSYKNRLMLTYSTGQMDNGWAFSLSGSRRWADEGYVEATFYDAYSLFASIEKKLNDKHSLNLVAFASPYKRGRGSGSVQEMYDIADNVHYNPNWGYQNGEKRNARVYDSNQPVGILRHDFEINNTTSLTTSLMLQTGRFGSSGLDWFNAADPRPDYWRKLPSAYEDETSFNQVWEVLSSDESKRQINWQNIYDSNRLNQSTVFSVDGVEGNDRTGFLSKYIIQEQRFDLDKYVFNTRLQTSLSDRVSLNAGIHYISEANHVFKTVNDLLGGEFYVDYDKFAERDFPGDNQVIQNDLNRPNRILDIGDRFGYDYDLNVRNLSGWFSSVVSLPKWDIHMAVQLSKTDFWREGFVKNGKFPDNSFGESEKQNFNNISLKGGLTYKLSGRNYIYANATYGTLAPLARHAYLSPRTRDQLVGGLDSETVYGGELGYIIRFPSVKGRITAYYSKFEDQVEVTSFYHDDLNSFVNFALSGVDQLHQGIEAAAEFKLTSELRATAALAVGQYLYDSRPTATISQDNNAELLDEGVIIYQQDYYVPGTPQRAYSFGLNYSSPKFWFASLTANYFDEIYLDFNPIRRTADAVSPITEESSPGLRDDILDQEKLDSDFTLDFFGGKSWKIGDYFIYLNAGINNILNNKDFRTGGYEQNRFDFETKEVDRFPPRYFYAYGTNYFVSVTLRL